MVAKGMSLIPSSENTEMTARYILLISVRAKVKSTPDKISFHLRRNSDP